MYGKLRSNGVRLACPAMALLIWCYASLAFAQGDSTARSLLLDAAEAMGGYERLRELDSFALTGFGQRYASNGALSADPKAPPKWEVVTDAERIFDLNSMRAVSRERGGNMFPFAARFGYAMNRSDQVESGSAVLDHPLPALLAALDTRTTLGAVRIEAGVAVVDFTIADGTSLSIGIDTTSHLPYWTRRITGDATLGDLTHTTWFTGYLPHEGVWLPTGIMEQIDWRDQVTLMFQVDSYRLDLDRLPAMEPPLAFGEAAAAAPPNVVVRDIAAGVWDVAVVRGDRRDGGAVVEFDDHLVMFEPYGSEAATLARIDAANRLVPGKAVTAVIVSHHHSDHAAGVRAVVSRGITLIGHRNTQPLYEEWVSRPAVLYPDALARSPQPLKFVAVDEQLILEDSMRRLEVFHAVGHLHMADAVFAYLPAERIILEGDFTDDTWDFNWWAGALQANMDRYGIEPELDIPVHGAVQSVAQKLAGVARQVGNAREFCETSADGDRFPLGCPAQYSIDGPL